ncbi:MAG: choice-of-anchor tandem repeat NxxGxxAF-containing protein [Phycisphaeraceae bacterium]
MRHDPAAAARALTFCCAVFTAANAQADKVPFTRIVSLTGDPVISGGTMTSMTFPAMNDNGRVGFLTTIDNAPGGPGTDRRMYVNDGGFFSREVVREGEAVPSGDGLFADFSTPILNNAGQVLFHSTLSGTTGGADDNAGVYLSMVAESVSDPTQVARKGASAPDGNGVFASFKSLSLNETGHSVFEGTLANTVAGGADDAGIYLAGPEGLTQIARKGQAVPGGNGVFAEFGTPRLNDAGQISFVAELAQTTNSVQDDTALYLYDPQSGLTQLLREGQSYASGAWIGDINNGTTNGFNNAGEVVFPHSLVTASNNWAMLRVGPNGAITELFREGEPSPDGNGTINYGTSARVLNEAGQTTTTVFINNSTRGSSDNTGVLLADGANDPVMLLREGQPALDGNGEFATFYSSIVNNAGQAVIAGQLRGTEESFLDNELIYFHDPALGMHKVAREGDDLYGALVRTVNSGSNGGINDAGAVAYRFWLYDGRYGIAVWQLVDRIPGDTDADFDIDDIDLGTIFGNYTGPLTPGTGGMTPADGDTDGDGDIDDTDLGTAFSAYTGPFDAAAVPEPTSLAAIVLAGTVLMRRRRA